MLIKTAMCSRKKWKGVRGRTEDLAFFFFCFLLPSPPFFLFTGAAAPPPSLIFSNLIWISGSRKLSSPQRIYFATFTPVLGLGLGLKTIYQMWPALLRQLSATGTASALTSQGPWLATSAVARIASASHSTGAGSYYTNTDLLHQWQKRFEGSKGGDTAAAVTLSLQPSSPAAPLLAGHLLFHPSDTASWLERWRQERPQDGRDPLQLLMAPGKGDNTNSPINCFCAAHTSSCLH